MDPSSSSSPTPLTGFQSETEVTFHSIKFQPSPAVMGVSKTLVVFLFMSLLLLQLVHADDQMANTDSNMLNHRFPKKMNCGGACRVRCSLSKRPKLCKRACGTCCARCNCVPPGTSGNEDTCPCYASLTTHHNRHKCP